MESLLLDYGASSSPLFYSHLRKMGNRFVIIADSTVAPLYGHKLQREISQEQLDCELLVFPAGESSKNRATKEELEDKMLAMGLDRGSVLIALGGGVTTDIGGYLAATFLRGIQLIHIPTSLLAMVDAAHGGKNGLNTNHGKNLIGTFYEPNLVVIDPNYLKSLPKKELLNGLSEMIKYGAIRDQSLLKCLDEPSPDLATIARCIEIKKEIVDQDGRDRGIRQLLNFGHTIGHALERASSYTLSHGVAIAIGMICETRLSSIELSEKLEDIFTRFNYPLTFSKKIGREAVLSAFQYDKKRIGSKLILTGLDSIGQATLIEVSMGDIEHLVDWTFDRFQGSRFGISQHLSLNS